MADIIEPNAPGGQGLLAGYKKDEKLKTKDKSQLAPQRYGKSKPPSLPACHARGEEGVGVSTLL